MWHASGFNAVPSQRGALVGLGPPNKAPSPQIEIWNIINQRNFCQIWMSSPPLHKRNPPTQKHPIDYLATVLVQCSAHYFFIVYVNDIATNIKIFYFRICGWNHINMFFCKSCYLAQYSIWRSESLGSYGLVSLVLLYTLYPAQKGFWTQIQKNTGKRF